MVDLGIWPLLMVALGQALIPGSMDNTSFGHAKAGFRHFWFSSPEFWFI